MTLKSGNHLGMEEELFWLGVKTLGIWDHSGTCVVALDAEDAIQQPAVLGVGIHGAQPSPALMAMVSFEFSHLAICGSRRSFKA